MIGRIAIVFLLIIGVWPSHLVGQSAVSSSIRHADSLYTEGAFTDALIEYQKLLSHGITDPDLLFNLGAAASQTSDIASAIYYFESALRYKYHDKKLHAAIKHERNSIENGVVPIESFFLKTWIYNFLTILRPVHWSLIGCVILLMALARWWQQQHILKNTFFLSRLPVLFYLGAGVLFLFIAVVSYKVIYRENEGIIFSECDVREAPTTDSPLTRQLHAGEKVIIQDELTDYYRVDLLNLDQGWIRKDCVRIIQPGIVQ